MTAEGDGNANGVWKWISGCLASVLITGGVAWFAFGRDTATTAQIEALRATQAADNQRFRDDLTQIRQTVSEMNGTLKAWRDQDASTHKR